MAGCFPIRIGYEACKLFARKKRLLRIKLLHDAFYYFFGYGERILVGIPSRVEFVVLRRLHDSLMERQKKLEMGVFRFFGDGMKKFFLFNDSSRSPDMGDDFLIDWLEIRNSLGFGEVL